MTQFTVEKITDIRTFELVCEVRRKVFEQDFGIRPRRLEFATPPDALHLLARLGPTGPVIAALSAAPTTGRDELHQRHGLVFPRTAQVVRYTQLAVLKRYRGLNLPLTMILEANSLFTAPFGFTHSWMAFPVRSVLPSFVRLLGFHKVGEPVVSDQGFSWVLVKAEGVVLTDPNRDQQVIELSDYQHFERPAAAMASFNPKFV
jgi:hypothetical protein